MSAAISALGDDFDGENEALGALLAAAAGRLLNQGAVATLTTAIDEQEVCDG